MADDVENRKWVVEPVGQLWVLSFSFHLMNKHFLPAKNGIELHLIDNVTISNKNKYLRPKKNTLKKYVYAAHEDIAISAPVFKGEEF